MTETYSLNQVAAEHLPPEWKDPERWLRVRLNRRELRGVRLGRTWRMRESDIAYMLARYSSTEVAPPQATSSSQPVSVLGGLSQRSRSRLRGVAS
jgi:hypothetical protein